MGLDQYGFDLSPLSARVRDSRLFFMRREGACVAASQ